jgi:hypothetical protein
MNLHWLQKFGEQPEAPRMDADWNDPGVYAVLYRQCLETYRDDPERAPQLCAALAFPFPECWDETALRLLALTKQKANHYREGIAPIELALRTQTDDRRTYRQLVDAYRQEYFRFQTRQPASRFYLDVDTHRRDAASLAYDFMVRQDGITALEHYEAMDSDVEYEAYEIALSELAELVEGFEPFDTGEKGNAFAQLESEGLRVSQLVIRAGTCRDSEDADREIERIRSLIQSRIDDNNRKAESALAETPHARAQILVEKAANEEQIVDFYRYLVARFEAAGGCSVTPELRHRPFVLYFDNYYADFDAKLAYWKQHYDGTSDPTAGPFYLKLHQTALAKLQIVSDNFAPALTAAKRAYIEDPYRLGELRDIRRQRYEALAEPIAEFEQYGRAYIAALRPDAQALARHASLCAEMTSRYLEQQ